jgi:hypothetical protein
MVHLKHFGNREQNSHDEVNQTTVKNNYDIQ